MNVMRSMAGFAFGALSKVSCVIAGGVAEPRTGTVSVLISVAPVRSLTNTIWRPSDAHDGWNSLLFRGVIRVRP